MKSNRDDVKSVALLFFFALKEKVSPKKDQRDDGQHKQQQTLHFFLSIQIQMARNEIQLQ